MYALLIISFIVAPVLFCQQVEDPRADSSTANTGNSEALHHLINHSLLIARKGDDAQLRLITTEMEIPRPESWFPAMLGKVEGQKRADQYLRDPQARDMHFQMLLVELARQGGKVFIEKTDPVKKYGASANRLVEYRATWRKTDHSAGPSEQTIGLFYFIEGTFRLDASGHELRVLSTSARGALTPATLISKIQPAYPMEARALRIQGAVSINVIVKKDGTVEAQNVGAGHPLLAPAAVEAVQQWRYVPAKIGGEPVDVETKVFVTFALKGPGGPIS